MIAQAAGIPPSLQRKAHSLPQHSSTHPGWIHTAPQTRLQGCESSWAVVTSGQQAGAAARQGRQPPVQYSKKHASMIAGRLSLTA